jgi:hypothetical protein
MTSSHPDSISYGTNKGGSFRGSWFSHFLWQCMLEGLEGIEAFQWAVDTLEQYSEIAPQGADWYKGYQAPQAGTVLRFTASGTKGTIPTATDACSTLCIEFKGADANSTSGSTALLCEVSNPPQQPTWQVAQIWHWTLGKTYYEHTFGLGGATGRYILAAHSNNYPVNALITWLPDTSVEETTSSQALFPGHSVGWIDGQADGYSPDLVGGGIYSMTFEPGVTLDQIPEFAGTPGTGFFETVGIRFPLVEDPDHLWIYENEDPFQGYAAPIMVRLNLSDIFNEFFEPANVLDIQLEAWQGGVPVDFAVVQAVRTGDGIEVEPWSIGSTIFPELFEVRYSPLSAALGEESQLGGIVILDALILDYRPMFPSGAEDPGTSALALRLWPAMPNPFGAQTTIRFALPAREPVRLGVYDLQGRLVSELLNEMAEPGQHVVTWDGRDQGGRRASSGIYFYRLELPLRVKTQKMVLAR